MTHSLANDSAKAALTRKIIAALEVTHIFYGFISAHSIEFDSVRTEAIKSVGKWMSLPDITHYIYSSFGKYFQGTGLTEGDSAGILLREVTTGEQREKFANAITEGLALIPITYNIQFPLHNIRGFESLALTENIKILEPADNTTAGVTPPTMLQIGATGFVANDRQNSAVKNAINIAKITLKVGTLYGLFSRIGAAGLLVSSLAEILSGTRTQVVHYARAYNVANTSEHGKILLGIGFSKYLNLISMPFDLYSDDLNRHVSRTSKILEILFNSSMQSNVMSINRALEWAFDADVDEDETTSFIKTCIGLEAILADQTGELGITAQLADRCAFVLHNTSTERAETRNVVKEIYSLRSKIVHGNVSGLSHHDYSLADKASTILSSVLKAEINAVVKWCTDRSQ